MLHVNGATVLRHVGISMGVDHGGDRGDKSPQNLERGDANTNCPPRLSYRYKN